MEKRGVESLLNFLAGAFIAILLAVSIFVFVFNFLGAGLETRISLIDVKLEATTYPDHILLEWTTDTNKVGNELDGKIVYEIYRFDGEKSKNIVYNKKFLIKQFLDGANEGGSYVDNNVEDGKTYTYQVAMTFATTCPRGQCFSNLITKTFSAASPDVPPGMVIPAPTNFKLTKVSDKDYSLKLPKLSWNWDWPNKPEDTDVKFHIIEELRPIPGTGTTIQWTSNHYLTRKKELISNVPIADYEYKWIVTAGINCKEEKISAKTEIKCERESEPSNEVKAEIDLKEWSN